MFSHHFSCCCCCRRDGSDDGDGVEVERIFMASHVFGARHGGADGGWGKWSGDVWCSAVVSELGSPHISQIIMCSCVCVAARSQSKRRRRPFFSVHTSLALIASIDAIKIGAIERVHCGYTDRRASLAHT